MKRLILAVLVVVASTFTGIAQSMKLGHINSQEIISVMPEYKEMQTVLQEKNTELTKELEGLQKVYLSKLKEYEDPATTETRRKVLEGDIIDLEQRIQQRQEAGQQQLEQLNMNLRTPILEKIDKAIKGVASEGSYNYVFDTAALLYFNDGDDLTAKVREKLGIANP